MHYLNCQTYALPDDLAVAVRASLEAWRVGSKVRRLWARDATLWTGTDEGEWLSWLGISEDSQALRVHLGSDVEAGLTTLHSVIQRALQC